MTDKTRQATSASHRAVITRANGDVVDLGVISYWHKNPLRRAAWRMFGQPRANRRIARFNASQPKE